MENQGKTGQVSTQLNELEKALEDQGAVIEDLGNRLNSVLRRTDETKESLPPKEDLVEFADELRRTVKMVTQHTDQLRNIMTRLEL